MIGASGARRRKVLRSTVSGAVMGSICFDGVMVILGWRALPGVLDQILKWTRGLVESHRAEFPKILQGAGSKWAEAPPEGSFGLTV